MMVCGITMYSIEILKFKLQCTGVVEKLNQKWTHSSGLFFFVVFFVVGFFCFVHLHYSILCFEKCTARWRAVVNKWLCITLVYSEICWRVFFVLFHKVVGITHFFFIIRFTSEFLNWLWNVLRWNWELNNCSSTYSLLINFLKKGNTRSIFFFHFMFLKNVSLILTNFLRT